MGQPASAVCDPGHTSYITDPADPTRQIAGDYNRVRNLNLEYGPLGTNSVGRVFDTWHPATAMDIDANGTVDPNELELSPPYIAYTFHPPRSNDTPPGPSSPLMQTPSTEQPSNRAYWAPNTDYNVGDVVFVTWVDQPSGGNPPDGLFSYSKCRNPNSRSRIDV